MNANLVIVRRCVQWHQSSSVALTLLEMQKCAHHSENRFQHSVLGMGYSYSLGSVCWSLIFEHLQHKV